MSSSICNPSVSQTLLVVGDGRGVEALHSITVPTVSYISNKIDDERLHHQSRVCIYQFIRTVIAGTRGACSYIDESPVVRNQTVFVLCIYVALHMCIN